MGAKTHLSRHIERAFMRWYLMRNGAHRLFVRVLATTLTAISPVVVAQQAPQDTHALDEIVVIGVTPVPGFKVDKDKIPGNIQTLRSNDLTRNRAAERYARGPIPA
jgi:hypothetical protein